ncbi:unnamed protein product [Discula destructiva]
MVSLHEVAALLQMRMSDLFVASDAYAYSWVITAISWFFMTLAVFAGGPIAFLIVFDFFLWIYRLVFPVITPASLSSSARRRPETSSNSQHHHPKSPS